MSKAFMRKRDIIVFLSYKNFLLQGILEKFRPIYEKVLLKNIVKKVFLKMLYF